MSEADIAPRGNGADRGRTHAVSPARFSYLSHLECSRCGARHEADRAQNTCACGAPLLARYDLSALGNALSRDEIGARRSTIWRYHEVLPVSAPERVVTLGEGMTPLLDVPTLSSELDLARLWIKDEGLLPTGTFKARGATVGVSRAAELGASGIAMPSNGNAAAAWAAYAARAGIRAKLAMPKDSPSVSQRESVLFGADLELSDGLLDSAAASIARATREGPWFDASTLKEPYRLEGKKTIGLEIIEQLGWRVPDVILHPTGGGVGLLGIHKALREAKELGWIEGEMPRLVAVQASGCAPIVEAWRTGATAVSPWSDPSTVAFGINVPQPFGDRLILDALADSSGCAVDVSDEQLLADLADLARWEGIHACPEGAAAVSAARQLRSSGWLDADDEVVLVNTGVGLKYDEAMPASPAARAGR